MFRTQRVRALTLIPALVVSLLWAAPAQAVEEDCSGVLVVVDNGSLTAGTPEEGTVVGACVEDGAGRPGAEVLESAGFELEFVPTQGFLCKVAGQPADVNCAQTPAADAYWGLYVDAPGGGWTYATVGITELTVEAGGRLGLAWQSDPEPRDPAAVTTMKAVGDSDTDPASDSSDDTDSNTALIIGIVVAVVVVAAGALAVVSRRRSQS